MKDHLIRAYQFNLEYAEFLVKDIPDSDAGLSGGKGLENSPLFVVGHLVTGAGLTAASFHNENSVTPIIRQHFERKGPADHRLPELGDIDISLSELVTELKKQHDLVVDGIISCPAEKWNLPRSWKLENYFPTFADATWFMCITHEALHLGQIAAWRRWYGLPSAMAKLIH